MMKNENGRILVKALVYILLTAGGIPVKGEPGVGPANGQIAAAVMGIAACGAAIGAGLYQVVSRTRSVTGAATPDGAVQS